LIKEIDIQEWQKYTDESADENPFLHTKWILSISSQYKLPIIILGYFENQKLISAIPFVEKKIYFKKDKLISLPFTDYISYANDIPDKFIWLLKDYIKNDYSSAEIRSHVSCTDKTDATLLRHYLRLDKGYEDIKSAYHKNNRRNIKQSEKHQLTFKISRDINTINEFCALNILTRKKHGLPPQPKSFFTTIVKNLFDHDLGFVATVYSGEKAIASAIFLTHKKTIIYKYGASANNYLKLKPNNFLMDSVIKYSCHNNYTFFDFGICPKDNTGLRRFKLGWGATEENICYVLINHKGINSYHKKRYHKIFHSIFKMLPSKLNVFLGEILYKYVA